MIIPTLFAGGLLMTPVALAAERHWGPRSVAVVGGLFAIGIGFLAADLSQPLIVAAFATGDPMPSRDGTWLTPATPSFALILFVNVAIVGAGLATSLLVTRRRVRARVPAEGTLTDALWGGAAAVAGSAVGCIVAGILAVAATIAGRALGG